MKLNTTDFLRKCQHPLVMALISIPPAVLLTIHAAPLMLQRMWLLPIAFVLLAWGCLIVPGKRRVLCGVLSAAALILMSWAVLEIPANIPLALLPVLYSVLIFMTLPIGGWERNRELSVAWHVIGVVGYVLMQLLIITSRRLAGEGRGVYDAAAGAVLGGFLALMVLVVLALNRASLDCAAMSRRKVPVAMRRQNVVITLVMMGLGIGIAAIPAIGAVLAKVWDLLMKGVAFVAALLMSLMSRQQSGGSGGGGGMMDEMGFGEAKEPSAFLQIMEKVLLVATILVLLVAVYFAGRALLKKLIILFRYLWKRLNQYSAAAGEDYEDEITDTREDPQAERSGLLGRLRRMAPEDEKGMNPNEKVRYRYKRMKWRKAWHRASTARENLPEGAAALYERVRYGGQTLTEEEASRFREETRRI